MTINVLKKPRFGDLKLRWEGELSDPSLVIRVVDEHLQTWIDDDVPSVWMSLSGKDLDHLNFFLSHGFTMHRIKNGNTIILNRWIRERSCTLPPAPFGYFGLGAMCFNSKGQILSVRENYKENPGPWKLPGGLFDTKKDAKLSDAVIRECFEETGVKATFDSIILQRFTTNSAIFHKLDMYTVCKLNAVTEEINYDPVEIADCRWFDPDEFWEVAPPWVREYLKAAFNNKSGLKEYPGWRNGWLYVPENCKPDEPKSE